MSKFDDTYRSDKSNERNVWEEEHFWDDGGASASSLSAGYHREGSFRAYSGLASQISQVGDAGRMMFTSDTSQLYDVSHDSLPAYLLLHEPIVVRPNQSNVTGMVLVASKTFGSHALSADRMIDVSDPELRILSQYTTVTSFQTGYSLWMQGADTFPATQTGMRINGGNKATAASLLSHNGLSLYSAAFSEIT